MELGQFGVGITLVPLLAGVNVTLPLHFPGLLVLYMAEGVEPLCAGMRAYPKVLSGFPLGRNPGYDQVTGVVFDPLAP